MSEETVLLRRYEQAATLSEQVGKAVLELMKAHLSLPDAGGTSQPNLTLSYEVVSETLDSLDRALKVGDDLVSRSEMEFGTGPANVSKEVFFELGHWFRESRSTSDRMGGGEEVAELGSRVRLPWKEWSGEDYDSLIRFASSLDAYVASLYAQLPSPGSRRTQDG